MLVYWVCAKCHFGKNLAWKVVDVVEYVVGFCFWEV